MAIKIHLPRAEKTVVIPEFSSLEELLFGSGKENLEKPATSLLMFRRILAYVELVAEKKVPKEKIFEHLHQSIEVYNSITEHDSIEPNEIETMVEERLKDDEFNKLYHPIIEEISSEIFKIFASGALSAVENDIYIENDSTEYNGVMQA